MEILVHSEVKNEAELHLLTDWGRDQSRIRDAGLLSVTAHVVVIVALILVPHGTVAPPPRREASHITPLIEPPTELTQKAPNKGKITKEISAEALPPRPRIKIPHSRPSTTRAP